MYKKCIINAYLNQIDLCMYINASLLLLLPLRDSYWKMFPCTHLLNRCTLVNVDVAVYDHFSFWWCVSTLHLSDGDASDTLRCH